MNLKRCRILVAFTFLLVQLAFIEMQALVPSMTYLVYSGTKKSHEVPAPDTWRLMTNPLLGAVLIAVSLITVVLVIRGLRREHGFRRGWIVPLVVAVLVFLEACGFAIWMQRLSLVFYDLGIK